MPKRCSYTVYYEDTDALAMVYYANYFKYFERGRTEYLAEAGTPIAELNASGVLIVVHSVNATFRKPATLGDRIDVVSTFTVPSPFRARFNQRIERSGELLVDAVIDVVCLNAQQQLTEVPELLRRLAEPD